MDGPTSLKAPDNPQCILATPNCILMNARRRMNIRTHGFFLERGDTKTETLKRVFDIQIN